MLSFIPTDVLDEIWDLTEILDEIWDLTESVSEGFLTYSCTKTADRVFFHLYSHVILQENIRFVYLLVSPRRCDSYKYLKRMSHKNLFKSIRYSCFRRVHIKFHKNKFDLTAKSLVTTTVFITRVLCTTFGVHE